MVKGRQFYVDGIHCGQALYLTVQQSKKSVTYDDYDTIIFDEFIITPYSFKIVTITLQFRKIRKNPKKIFGLYIFKFAIINGKHAVIFNPSLPFLAVTVA